MFRIAPAILFAHGHRPLEPASRVFANRHEIGFVRFKDPRILDRIAYHASYIVRPGSVDLGIKSISGSREANLLVLAGALQIMGSRGYALLIENGIETARAFGVRVATVVRDLLR